MEGKALRNRLPKLRKPMLYPPELQAHIAKLEIGSGFRLPHGKGNLKDSNYSKNHQEASPQLACFGTHKRVRCGRSNPGFAMPMMVAEAPFSWIIVPITRGEA
jgi:hypothetical protein